MQCFKTYIPSIIIIAFLSCGTPKYVLNDQFKNKKGTTEMAVLIINTDKTINADVTQKVATIYKSYQGYNTTSSLLSKQFITDGLFDKVFASEKFNFSKENIKNYADYICLGKLTTEITSSTLENGMLKATAILKIKIVSTSNGAAINNFTKDAVGIGFSKRQAINVAIENIINSLK